VGVASTVTAVVGGIVSRISLAFRVGAGVLVEIDDGCSVGAFKFVHVKNNVSCHLSVKQNYNDTLNSD
jgi:hypothetical protein